MTAATMTTISTIEFGRRAGITYRMIDYWTRAGALVPAKQAEGSGTAREFDQPELRIALVLRSLRRYGASLDAMRTVADEIRQWSDLDWSGYIFVDDAGGIHRAPLDTIMWALDLGAHARAGGPLDLGIDFGAHAGADA